MEERRRSRRYKVATEIKGKVKSTMKVQVIDMSEHGMLVEAPSGLPPNGVCEITISAPSGEHTLLTNVRRCRAQVVNTNGRSEILYHAGLEFDASRVDATELKNLIAEVCAMNGASPDGPKAEVSTDSKGFRFAM